MKDWYQHYIEKHLNINPEDERPFVEFVLEKCSPGSRILECGTGLGRSAAALASFGKFRVITVDIEPRIQDLAKLINREFFEASMLGFLNLDFRHLSYFFPRNAFDACTHAGVLEHFPKNERISLLSEQLKVGRSIFISIPLATNYNLDYFSKGPFAWRDLKTIDDWEKEFNENFCCKSVKEVRQRTDNGFFYLEDK